MGICNLSELEAVKALWYHHLQCGDQVHGEELLLPVVQSDQEVDPDADSGYADGRNGVLALPDDGI